MEPLALLLRLLTEDVYEIYVNVMQASAADEAQKIRIKMKSYDVRALESSCAKIKEV